MKARHSLATVSCVIGLAAVAGLLALPEGIIGQDSKPVAKVQQAEAGQSWTCPMHPQLTRHDQGRCPICAMSLVRTKRDESAPLASLDQMLGIAMKHNPDVRAGRGSFRAVAPTRRRSPRTSSRSHPSMVATATDGSRLCCARPAGS